MRLMIVRHGDPDYIHDSLTEKGKREAELLSKRLAKMDIQEFYQSPLGRAQLTRKTEKNQNSPRCIFIQRSIYLNCILDS